jgi:hypothetical protein
MLMTGHHVGQDLYSSDADADANKCRESILGPKFSLLLRHISYMSPTTTKAPRQMMLVSTPTGTIKIPNPGWGLHSMAEHNPRELFPLSEKDTAAEQHR